jgi:diaminopimelate decarboxylase
MEALEKALDLIDDLKAENIYLSHIDIGGGIGVEYNNEKTIDIENYIQSVINMVGDLKIIIEPGRSIVGDAGIFVTKVEHLKQNDSKSFAIIDGAMNDLIRPALYGSYHNVVKVRDNNDGVNASWDIVGPVCETADFLAKDRRLNLKEGDYIAIMTAGAYGFVLSSNYNSRPRVAEVMVSGDNHGVIRKRETIELLFDNELIFKNETNK